MSSVTGLQEGTKALKRTGSGPLAEWMGMLLSPVSPRTGSRSSCGVDGDGGSEDVQAGRTVRFKRTVGSAAEQ